MFRSLIAASLLLVSVAASAEDFPSRPITLVVPFAAGGPTDVVARNLARSMGKALKQTIIVDNRPSSGGIIGSEFVLQAKPDGYTLLLHNIGMATLKALSPDLRFNPSTDFSYVGQVVDVPMTLVGAKKLSAHDFPALAAYLRTHQKDVNLANAGIGTASHLCGLLLMSQLKVALTTIPYKGAAPAMTDLQGGQVDLLCDQITTTIGPIQTNRVQAYGSTTRARLPLLPALATLDEQGLKGFEVTVWHGIYGPKGVPAPVLSRLSQALQAALADPEFKTSMERLGATPVDAGKASPQGLLDQLRSQEAVWSPLIRNSSAFLQ
ncbi:tripartite tricarboxylate transporter substrate binding protein [Bordetella sp. LUAb4]|uniref:Bug family tripartite tricarboxylate transporter substrate binding protein n=1 Tax=Bordetella sp. LUAb4 TaxID=2843195 RepID=UPI001E3D84AD|nr:tripartite tricarboxylate transporter substrate-binding protein [Bordetella sp. LUAb4]